MGSIRIEYVPIQSFNLGLFGIDHIQLVYQDETDLTNDQDGWYVLEGIRDVISGDVTLGALGENGRTTLAAANLASGEDLIDKIGRPEDRGSRVIASGPDSLALWDQLASYAAEVQAQYLPYIAVSWPFGPTPIINSTSLISSVLHSVGLDLSTLQPYGVGFSPGGATVIGSTGNDTIAAGGSITQVLTGLGDDILSGTSTLIFPEKLYGGEGRDTIRWSGGDNFVHGGEPGLAYADDGVDTADYSGAGIVYIEATGNAVEHKTPTYIATFTGGSDRLFSIEQIAWDRDSDTIIVGEGVDLLERAVLLDLKGDSGGRGDVLGLSGSTGGIIVNAAADDIISVQSETNAGLDSGYFAQSVEWLVGSAGNDRIYTGNSVRGAEGGAGNDTLDGRLSVAFSATSPQGYDIELDGGDGADTLVSGAGLTLARGGIGADVFVLSAMSSGAGLTEFVITDADAADRLYVPYDFFSLDRGDYDGSDLFQLTGGPFKITAENPADIFQWFLPGDDQVHGFIDFTGFILFEYDGTDLVISLLQSTVFEQTIPATADTPERHLFLNAPEEETLTIIRVRDWSDGDLGITSSLVFDPAVFEAAGSITDYPGYEDAIRESVSPDRFMGPLAERPAAYLPAELDTAQSAREAPVAGGSEGDDVIVAPAGRAATIEGLGGNDDLTGGRGGDLIDGGAGADIMRGGAGNDTYYVDQAGDQVIELAGGGFDRIFSAVTYTLGDYLEHLVLTGAAAVGTGNSLRNTLEGNAAANVLDGLGGNDTLVGNGGDDVLIGGDGSDGYIYETGDGDDTIIDNGSGASESDVLILTGDLQRDDVSFHRVADAADTLLLQFADGGSVSIAEFFTGAGRGVERIEFADGTSIGAAEFASRAAAAEVASNFAPRAMADAYVYTLGSAFTLQAAALLVNDTDRDGDGLHIAAISNVSGGSAALDLNGDVEITAMPDGSNAAVTFTYTVSDGRGGTSSAVARIGFTVGADSGAPLLTAISIDTVTEDTAAGGGVTASDPNGDLLTYGLKAGSGPAKGTVSFGIDGAFVFTPFANANGADAFTVLVTDTGGATAERRIAFDIGAVNDDPLAVADTGLSGAAGDAIEISAARLLANDSDVDGDALSITSVTGATGGTVQLTAAGDVVFNASTAFTGLASFTYRIGDGQGGDAAATVTLEISGDAEPRRIVGTGTVDVLTGTRNGDVLIGRGGNDWLRGRAGNDVFEVRGNDGTDQISGGAGIDTVRGSSGSDAIGVLSRLANLQSVEAIDGGDGFDRIFATGQNDRLDFSAIALTGIERIDLGGGDDIVRGSSANDTFRGGRGADTYLATVGGGHDVITDFATDGPAHDRIDVRAFGYARYADVRQHLTYDASGALLSFDGSTSIRLEGVTQADIGRDLFKFA